MYQRRGGMYSPSPRKRRKRGRDDRLVDPERDPVRRHCWHACVGHRGRSPCPRRIEVAGPKVGPGNPSCRITVSRLGRVSGSRAPPPPQPGSIAASCGGGACELRRTGNTKMAPVVTVPPDTVIAINGTRGAPRVITHFFIGPILRAQQQRSGRSHCPLAWLSADERFGDRAQLAEQREQVGACSSVASNRRTRNCARSPKDSRCSPRLEIESDRRCGGGLADRAIGDRRSGSITGAP